MQCLPHPSQGVMSCFCDEVQSPQPCLPGGLEAYAALPKPLRGSCFRAEHAGLASHAIRPPDRVWTISGCQLPLLPLVFGHVFRRCLRGPPPGSVLSEPTWSMPSMFPGRGEHPPGSLAKDSGHFGILWRVLHLKRDACQVDQELMERGIYGLGASHSQYQGAAWHPWPRWISSSLQGAAGPLVCPLPLEAGTSSLNPQMLRPNSPEKP